jgi:CubicO group peptidase (beta-lactamase class C family)
MSLGAHGRHTRMDTSRLARLHEILSGDGVPGFMSGISRDGERHIFGDGVQTVGGAPVTTDTIFRISSMTKPVTGVAALILLEECVIRLDEPVERFLPELADRRVVTRIDGPVEDTVPADRSITVRDLLTFRMGFGGYFGPCPTNDLAATLDLAMGPPHPARPLDPDEWMGRFSTLPLMCQPGERWLYHTGAEVLGVLIARASGQPLETFMRERIFEPLGMKDTGFSVRPQDQARFTSCYAGSEVFDAPDGQWSAPPAFPSGADGLVSTIDDYLAFAEMLLAGGASLLSRPTVETMTTDQLTPEQRRIGGFAPGDFDASSWGFCVGVVTRRDHPAAPVGQYGWDGGLGSLWKNDPSERMACVLLTNSMWTSPQPPDIAQDFLTGAYAALSD